MRETGMIIAVHTKLVRPAVIERTGHANQARGSGKLASAESNDSGNAAHASSNLRHRRDSRGAYADSGLRVVCFNVLEDSLNLAGVRPTTGATSSAGILLFTA